MPNTFEIAIKISLFGRSPKGQLTLSHFVKTESDLDSEELLDYAEMLVSEQQKISLNIVNFMSFKIKQIKSSKNNVVAKGYRRRSLKVKGLRVPAGNPLAPEYTVLLTRDADLNKNGTLHLRGVLEDADVQYGTDGRPTIKDVTGVGKIKTLLIDYMAAITDDADGFTQVIPFNPDVKDSTEREVPDITYLAIGHHKIYRVRKQPITKEIEAANSYLKELGKQAADILGDVLMQNANAATIAKIVILVNDGLNVIGEIPQRYRRRLKAPDILKSLPPGNPSL